MASDPPCKGDAFAPYLDAPMPAPKERTCAVCGKATKELAEAGMRQIYGMDIRLPGPFGKCLGTLDKEVPSAQ